MSDTNRVALRYVQESTFGVTPVSPAFRDLPITGAPNLAFQPETRVSEQLRADRQVSDLILVGAQAQGDLPGELAFRAADDLIEAAFFGTWQQRYQRKNRPTTQISAVVASTDVFTVTDQGNAPVVNDIVRAEGFTNPANNGFHMVTGSPSNTSVPVTSALVDETPPTTARLHVVGRRAATSDIAAATGPNRITSSALDFSTLGLAVGDWIKLRNFATPANNDYVRISVIAANALTFDRVPTGWAADPGTGVQVELYLGERLVNGVLKRSFTLEREFGDHSPVTYEYLRGMTVGGLTFTAPSQSIVTTQFSFLGAASLLQDSGRFSGATTIPTDARGVLNSSSNVGRIARGGTPISGKNFVTELSVEINNNLRNQNAVGFLGAVAIGAGECGVSGSLHTYFDDKSLAQDVINNVVTSIDARFQDNEQHALFFDLPRVKFSEGSPEVPGKNQDVVLNLSYQAILDEVLGYTIKLLRFNGVQ